MKYFITMYILMYLCFSTSAFALSYDELCSENYMISLRKELINIQLSDKMSENEKKAALEKRISDLVISDQLTQIIFGLHYKEFSVDQAAELKNELGVYFMKKYHNNLLKHMTSDVQFVRFSDAQDNPYCTIRARIGKTIQERMDILYKLYIDKDTMHIIDIGVNGLSVAVAQREYFNNMMTVNKVSPDGVLAELKQYNANH